MARVLKGSQFYLHTPRSSANGMNHTCLCGSSTAYKSTDLLTFELNNLLNGIQQPGSF